MCMHESTTRDWWTYRLAGGNTVDWCIDGLTSDLPALEWWLVNAKSCVPYCIFGRYASTGISFQFRNLSSNRSLQAESLPIAQLLPIQMDPPRGTAPDSRHTSALKFWRTAWHHEKGVRFTLLIYLHVIGCGAKGLLHTD